MGYGKLLALAILAQSAFVSAQVIFKATATGGIRIDGECPAASSWKTNRKCESKPCNAFRAEVDLNSCTSKNWLRDRHTKDMLHASAYPKALLIAVLSGADGPFKGVLSLNSVTHTVEGEIAGDKLSFKVLLSNHGIKRPAAFGVTPADEVLIEASLGETKSGESLSEALVDETLRALHYK